MSLEKPIADPSRLLCEQVRHAIAQLGCDAHLKTPTGALAHWGEWLGWPEWMRRGTSLKASAPFPDEITLADDLLVTANLLDKVGEVALIQQALTQGRLPISPVSAVAAQIAPTLGATLDIFCRRTELRSGWLRIDRREAGGMMIITVRPTIDAGQLADFLGLFFLAVFWQLLAGFRSRWPTHLSFATTYHDRPDLRILWQIFECEVETGADRTEVRFPADWALVANAHHDSELWRVALDRIERELEAVQDPDLPAQVRLRIASILDTQRRVPRLKQVAAEEGWSERTLVRRLSEHGLRFHAMVEQERRKRAEILINDPAMSLGQMASALAFTDMSSFVRSFRTWFGETPGRVRKREAELHR